MQNVLCHDFRISFLKLLHEYLPPRIKGWQRNLQCRTAEIGLHQKMYTLILEG